MKWFWEAYFENRNYPGKYFMAVSTIGFESEDEATGHFGDLMADGDALVSMGVPSGSKLFELILTLRRV
jgi:hypothetical protein